MLKFLTVQTVSCTKSLYENRQWRSTQRSLLSLKAALISAALKATRIQSLDDIIDESFLLFFDFRALLFG